MVIENALTKRRPVGFGALALASLLSFAACADSAESDDVDAVEADARAEADEQTGAPDELAAVAVAAADPGANHPNNVATLGDSWMSNTLFTGNAITGALARQGHRYQNYAVQGVMLLKDNIFGRSILNQGQRVINTNNSNKANPRFKTIVITGGGNDIIENPSLQRDCGKRPIGDVCEKKLTEIEGAMVGLWERLGASGVKDIVYVAYSPAAGSAPAAAEASRDRLKVDCAEATAVKCHFVDTTDIVSKSDLILDGIHPNQRTNNEIAQEVYRVLTEAQAYR